MSLGHNSAADYLPAINRLVEDIDQRDMETAEMKRTVNRLCGYAGLPEKYPNIDDALAASKGTRIKPGQFYRKPLATAVTAILNLRGDPNQSGEGPATLEVIYALLKEGGFEFDATSDVNAKRALAISLAKNSQTFEKLPTGEFGLKAWYQRNGE
jgi:hypothetical protein